MLPNDVRITAEVEQHSILLRNVDQLSCLGMTECQFARSTEGDANGAVLVGSPLLIECCRVMMERLPVRSIPVPIETGTTITFCCLKVLTHSLQDLGVGGRASWILTQQMCSFMPRDPLCLSITVCLTLAHLLDESVVCVPIIFLAKELWHNNDIIMLHRCSIAFGRRHCDDSHGWPRWPGCNLLTTTFVLLTMRKLAVVTEVAAAKAEISAWSLLGGSRHRASQLLFFNCLSASTPQRHQNVHAAGNFGLSRMPLGINITSKKHQGAIFLRKVENFTSPRTSEGQLTGSSQGQVQHNLVSCIFIPETSRTKLHGRAATARVPSDLNKGIFVLHLKILTHACSQTLDGWDLFRIQLFRFLKLCKDTLRDTLVTSITYQLRHHNHIIRLGVGTKLMAFPTIHNSHGRSN
mmetsp:Transcript_51658/g.112556  ORF Transcript_51658/g.112556 Transcript_51658/m.112556 type:complete len:408 (-) Transcript_51658:467-1690(-)